jgi:hypothetical protein
MKKLLFLLMFCIAGQCYANSQIAVLDVELDDGTLLPNAASEVKRTASFKPLLENALKNHYQIVAVDKAVQQQANAGKGYLFEHDDLSADLGKKLSVDWLVVAQHKKVSFMYSSLWVHLINVKTQQLAGSYFVDLKGSNQAVSERSMRTLAGKIYQTMQR